ncbi:MAG: hypothetical protein IJ137_09760 [Eubacterium sp.]|nr:hypothetical protein [Eubacterium sp.]
MNTILEELRKQQIKSSVLDMDQQSETAKKEEVKLTGVYRCRACGYIFDEALEGKPFSTLTECPLCHVSPGGFMRLR